MSGCVVKLSVNDRFFPNKDEICVQVIEIL
jgi:hypothetical protein